MTHKTKEVSLFFLELLFDSILNNVENNHTRTSLAILDEYCIDVPSNKTLRA